MLALLVLVFTDAETSILSYGISTRLFALLILIFLIPTLFSYKKGEYNTRDAFYLLGMLLFLGTSFNAMIVLRNMNLYILIYLFMPPCFFLSRYTFSASAQKPLLQSPHP